GSARPGGARGQAVRWSRSRGARDGVPPRQRARDRRRRFGGRAPELPIRLRARDQPRLWRGDTARDPARGRVPAHPRTSAAAALHGSMSADETVVLVVEDEEGMRDAIAVVLGQRGFSVRKAAHGAQALAMLRAGLRPHVIVLDLRMPVVDGWTVLVEL